MTLFCQAGKWVIRRHHIKNIANTAGKSNYTQISIASSAFNEWPSLFSTSAQDRWRCHECSLSTGGKFFPESVCLKPSRRRNERQILIVTLGQSGAFNASLISMFKTYESCSQKESCRGTTCGTIRRRLRSSRKFSLYVVKIGSANESSTYRGLSGIAAVATDWSHQHNKLSSFGKFFKWGKLKAARKWNAATQFLNGKLRKSTPCTRISRTCVKKKITFWINTPFVHLIWACNKWWV